MPTTIKSVECPYGYDYCRVSIIIISYRFTALYWNSQDITCSASVNDGPLYEFLYSPSTDCGTGSSALYMVVKSGYMLTRFTWI